MKPSESITSVCRIVLTILAMNGLAFAQQWTGSSTTTGIISRSGNVGIGTTTPGFKLDVQPISSANVRLGKAEIGAWPANPSIFAYFGHEGLDHTGAGNYALLQGPNGDTYLNAAFGQSIQFRINNGTRMILASNGNVGIGTLNPQSFLAVNGTITAKEVVVTLSGWSDFVFDENYQLPSLEEVERQLKEKKHLPDIPSEQEVLASGVNLGAMQAKLLQKIEELTLYVIELKKENQRLQQQFAKLEKAQ